MIESIPEDEFTLSQWIHAPIRVGNTFEDDNPDTKVKYWLDVRSTKEEGQPVAVFSMAEFGGDRYEDKDIVIDKLTIADLDNFATLFSYAAKTARELQDPEDMSNE